MKKLILGLMLFLAISVNAQNPPQLIGWEVDTMCSSTFNHQVVHTIEVYDADGDYTTLNVDSYNPGHFISVSADMPPYVAGQTSRFFTITASPSTGLPPGLNLSDMNITMTGNLANDGSATSGTITDVPIYGNLILSFDVSSLSMCSNSQPIDLRPYASPAGGTFYWAGQQSYMFDPAVYISQGGTEINYDYKNPAGCYASIQSFAPVLNPSPALSISASNSTCGNADGSISSSISGGFAPYELYWSTGALEMVSGGIPADVTNLPAGNYYGNVTDVNGCKAVAVAHISDAEISVLESLSPESCVHSSNDGAIALSIAGGGTVTSIYWSNGDDTQTITGLTKGDYSVSITTDGGCKYFNTYSVSFLPEFVFENVNSTPATCNAAEGVIDYDITVGSSTYSYLWSNGATTQDIMNATPGYYECLITDLATGCTKTYGHQVIAVNGPGGGVSEVTSTSCNQNEGAIDIYSYPNLAPIVSYSWNTGQTTEDLENVGAGTYEITITDLNGCIFRTTAKIENIKPERPAICLMTVDSSLTYNQIVWEKDITQPEIAGFNVYRELSTFGDFQLVSTRPYSLESIYQDNAASPIDRAWRYYITAYDECGSESYGSDVHKTIHVVSNTSNLIDYTLSWDEYEGINYTSVNLLRYDDVNGWVQVDNIPFGTNTYLDTPPVISGLDYMVEFILADPCTSTKAQDHNSSRSNKTASIFNPGGSTVQLVDEDMGVISLYPNPAASEFTIHVDKPEEVEHFEITDLSGNIIQTGIITSNNTTVFTHEMAAGVYLVKIYSENHVVTQKLVVN